MKKKIEKLYMYATKEETSVVSNNEFNLGEAVELTVSSLLMVRYFLSLKSDDEKGDFSYLVRKIVRQIKEVDDDDIALLGNCFSEVSTEELGFDYENKDKRA